MIKGVQKQIVVVQSPDPELFEQAIFIVHGSVQTEMQREQMLAKACEVAASYLEGGSPAPKQSFSSKIPSAVYAAAAAVAAAAAWLAAKLVGV